MIYITETNKTIYKFNGFEFDNYESAAYHALNHYRCELRQKLHALDQIFDHKDVDDIIESELEYLLELMNAVKDYQYFYTEIQDINNND